MKLLTGIALSALLLAAQTPDVWKPLAFLEGTWEAHTDAKPNSDRGINAAGTYTFRKELGGHIMARHSSAAGCKGPADFDCDHTDLLYIYQDDSQTTPGHLKAIYFDNEGHTIHYTVSTPSRASAEFLSDPSAPGPQFRLIYELTGSIMSGKFQMRPPGKTEWTSYLEWAGAKR